MKIYNEKLDSLKFWAPGLVLSVLISLVSLHFFNSDFCININNELLLKLAYLTGMLIFLVYSCVMTLIIGFLRNKFGKKYSNFHSESVILAIIIIIAFCLGLFLNVYVNYQKSFFPTIKTEFKILSNSISYIVPLVLFIMTLVSVLIRLIHNKEFTMPNFLRVTISLILIFLFLFIYLHTCFGSAYWYTLFILQ